MRQLEQQQQRKKDLEDRIVELKKCWKDKIMRRRRMNDHIGIDPCQTFKEEVSEFILSVGNVCNFPLLIFCVSSFSMQSGT